MYIPLSEPWITDFEKNNILKNLKIPQLTDGPKLRKFESSFAKKIGSKYAIGVSNGTAALHLSLLSLGIKERDEVIIPDMTFVATANAVFLTRAKPVLADIDSTLNISPDSIYEKITKKTKAIIPVHFAGLAANMNKILKIAKENNLHVIEDSAHSFGTTLSGKHVGTFGDTGCFSFYPTKNITTIEGGMVTTDSKKIADKIRSLRNHGLTRSLLDRNKTSKPWNYDVINPGYNYRLDEIRSVLGLSQLTRSNQIQSKRIAAAKYYNEKMKDFNGIKIVNFENEKNHAYHLYIIRIKENSKISRDKLHQKLFQKGIRTTVHYKPLHMFSCFKKHNLKNNKFLQSSLAFKECLSLPLFSTISIKQQNYVIKNIKFFSQ